MKSLLATALAGLMLVPTVSAYADRSSAIEPGADADGRWSPSLFLAGALAFGGSYGPALAAASISDRPEDDHLYIPVAGPWLALHDGSHGRTATTLLIVDGVIQGGSVIAMAAGLLTPSRPAVGTRTAILDRARDRDRTRLVPLGGEVTGAAVRGTW